MGFPFFVFWILIILGRAELGLKRVLFCVAIWLALLVGFVYLNISPYFLVVAQALLDVDLILVIFGRDIRIR